MFNPLRFRSGLWACGKRTLALQAILLTDPKADPDRKRVLVARAGRLLGLVLCLFILSGMASAQTYPAPWPSAGVWINYTQLNQAVQDLSTAGGDQSDGGTGVNPSEVDVFNGTLGTLGSAYYYYDAANQVLFFRMRLRGDPRASHSAHLLSPYTWDNLLDTDGDGYKELFIEVNGSDDNIHVYYGDTNQQDISAHATCAANGQGVVYSVAITIGSTGNVLVTDLTASGGGYLFDYQVPLSAFKNCSGAQVLTATMPFSIAFSTSATTQDPTQKDFIGPGTFTMTTTTKMPYGDVVTLSGGIEQKPRLMSYSQSCGGGTNGSPVTLTASTLDTLTLSAGTVIDTIASVTFSYRRNGTTTWTQINSPVTTPITNTVNQWTTSWVTSGLTPDTYYIKIVIIDSQGNTVTTTGYGLNISNCSSVTPSVVTQVDLAGFKAVRTPDGRTFIEWQTGYEVGNLGFNLYRDTAGQRTRLNTSLIGGTAVLGGMQTPFTAGFGYAWMDTVTDAKSSSLYWLEDIDASGKTVLHGPISPVAVSQLPPQSQSLMLSQLRSNAPGATVEKVSVATSTAQKSAPRLSSTDIQKQWEIAAKPGVKVMVSKAGWYRITQAQLVAAGLDSSIDPRFLQLFTDAREVPIIVNGGSKGRLDTQDSIEFYATAIDTPSTNRRAFYLTYGALPGRRVAAVFAAKGTQSRRLSFTSTLERRDRLFYFPSLNNGEAENWFGAIVSPTPFNQSLTIAKVNQEAIDDAVLEVGLQGLGSAGTPAHTVRLQLNGQEVGTMSFAGDQHPVAQFHVSQRLLQEGTNTLTLTALGNPDFSVIDWVRLSYAHRFQADQNALLFTASGGELLQVSGFTTAGIRVFDITDEQNPVELKAQVDAEGKSYRAQVAAQEGGERVLLAVSDKGYGQGAQVVAQTPSSWHDAGQGADVLMITHASLRSALDPLVELRRQQGYQVAVVDVEDLYDEYSYGQHSGQAIQDFIVGTRSWKKPPRWVLLVGDASSDAKNYLGLGENDLVPTRLVWTNTFETASDDWLGDVNGDGLADVALGRLPVRTLGQAQTVVTKIISYEQGMPTSGALIVADTAGEYDFEVASQSVEQELPAGTPVQEVFRSQMDDTTANRAIIDAINRGPKLVNYAGHGSMSVWRGSLLTVDSVPLLTNQQALPVVISMTCLNNLFHDPRATSLGESLLLWERGGAVAVWASSAQTLARSQELINQEVVRQLFINSGGFRGGQRQTIGEAILHAKAISPDAAVIRSWVLLGDPLLRLR